MTSTSMGASSREAGGKRFPTHSFWEEWFSAEGERFHTMDDAWHGAVQKTAWPSCVIVRTRMASDMDVNRRSEMSCLDSPRERKMAEN